MSAKKTQISGRPLILDPIFKSVRGLPGIGPKTAGLFETLAGPTVRDLIFHLPSGFIDRSFTHGIEKAEGGKIATLVVNIVNHAPSFRRGQPYRVHCEDEQGKALHLVFFHANKSYLLKQLPLNEKRLISGRVDFYHGTPQIVHPDFIGDPEDKDDVTGLEATYPLTAGLTPKVVRKAVHNALKELPDLPEWQDAAFIKKQGWSSFKQSLTDLHHLQAMETLAPESNERKRLTYDELLSTQLALAMVRHHQRAKKGRIFPTSNHLSKKLLAHLPFELTGAQKQSLAEINQDMNSENQMLRLLQGDVGSGKTIVALLACFNAIEAGSQAAIMAPTEILARQHFEGTKAWCDYLGIQTIILTGADKGKTRKEALEKIENGDAQIIFGTHALFQDQVTFKDLGFAVIDEQHRFGVHQRLTLSAKGNRPDVLVMTATPIPRSLTLTAYGDMDVSRLNEKPKGRKPIDTRLISHQRIDAVIQGLKQKITQGERAYWVCPLVEESEVLKLTAAEDRYKELCTQFGADHVGLVHGQMKPADKDKVMNEFKNGTKTVLVSTTVIEVGVDVPEATVMIIEHAERFGLAQLHQLRGRVGRGDKPSSCILVYSPNPGNIAKERLDMMRTTEDGFLIAEKDLELRGAGEILGTRQSGLPGYKLANLYEHSDLVRTAFDDARLILDKDPHLTSERGQALKYLLYLFQQDQAIQYLRSG